LWLLIGNSHGVLVVVTKRFPLDCEHHFLKQSGGSPIIFRLSHRGCLLLTSDAQDHYSLILVPNDWQRFVPGLNGVTIGNLDAGQMAVLVYADCGV
jgi:hypothetical protein